jgi:hypothetical protein
MVVTTGEKCFVTLRDGTVPPTPMSFSYLQKKRK